MTTHSPTFSWKKAFRLAMREAGNARTTAAIHRHYGADRMAKLYDRIEAEWRQVAREAAEKAGL